ncbi:restriction endonuclease subunit S [Xanthobacter aminoxidans]|uniref:restriction endonuclease subunit S n=1 Tax=Xanthobacter aminoxidans TaxID=186280 RepID=UPI00372AD5CD
MNFERVRQKNSSNWPQVCLGELAEHRLGKMLDKQKNTGLPRRYLRNPNIKWFEFDLSDLQEIRVEEKDVHKYELQDGDVLICEGGEAGRAAIWQGDSQGIIFQKACHRVRVGPNLDARFLVHRLMFDYYNGGLEEYYTGATIKHFTGQDLARYKIPLPPLDEQKRIAAILDKADALRRKRRQALALLDSLTQSIFLEMFGDPVSNPKGWPVRELGDFEAFLTSGSRGWAEFYAEEGSPFIRIQNLKNGKLSADDLAFVKSPNNAEARRTTVSSGDVLISITADLGRIAVVPPSFDGVANINQHIALFRPKSINSVFLASYLAGEGGKRQFSASNRQGVKAGLNFTDIRRLRIMSPPLEMQDKFEKNLASLEIRQKAYSASDNRNDSLFASLQHRAFTGQL